MKTQILRTDDKIRQRFIVRDGYRIIAKGHIYEQRNVMLTERNGVHVSEQYSSLDAMLQTIGEKVSQIRFL
jgi:hypothetical protein